MKRVLFTLAVCCWAVTHTTAQRVASARTLNQTMAEVGFDNGQTLTVDFYADNIVRLYHDPMGNPLRSPEADPPAQILVEKPRCAVNAISAQRDADAHVISTPRAELRFYDNGQLTVIDRRTDTRVMEFLCPPTFSAGQTELTLSLRPGEHFYGGGVQNGRFSHRGSRIAIENTNVWVDGGVASPSPFYWSTKGYGLLWHTFKPGHYDFGQTDAEKVLIQHDTDRLDVFLMLDSQPEELLNDYYQLTGKPVLLPKFGFYEGHLNAYNRDYWTESANGSVLLEDGKRYHESQKANDGVKESLNGELDNYMFSARAAIDRYLQNDLPLGWFLPNDGYGAGYGQAATLDGNVENLRQFGDYARAKGVEIGLWTQSDLHLKEGVEPLLQRDIVREVRDAGVRVLKTDVAWVGPGYSFGLNGIADAAQIMPTYGQGARPFIITLDGWAGTQRYAGVWTGDQTGGDWEYIRFHIPTFIGSGLSGQPNITNDMDGIFGGNNPTVNIRDFQWKTFTPMELNMDGWGSNPKYPHALGEPATSINRHYLKLKSELMPYAYTIAHDATEGKPMVRALFLDFPNDYTMGKQTQYEFLYGPSLLVAPVYQATAPDAGGNDVRHGIYLPEGLWIDYWNGDTYEGGRVLNDFPAPLWKLPVFVKSGAILPMTQPHNTPAELRRDYRAYEIYPTAPNCFVEYDDDGLTEDYRQGRCTYTEILTETDKNHLSVHIKPTIGEFNGFEAMKETELRINLTAAPKKVTAFVGGRKVKLRMAATRDEYLRGNNTCFYDPAPELNRFATPGSDFAGTSIRKNPQLLIHLAKADVRHAAIRVEVQGVTFDTSDKQLRSHGNLVAPSVTFTDDNVSAFTLTPSWQPVENADYCEIEYDGMVYSTIRGNQLLFDGLQPETDHSFKVRAVNADGVSPWTTAKARTKADPYQHALKGIMGQTSCADQPGQGIQKLLDYDTKTTWHTDWNTKAVPFDLTLDLRTVNTLDKLAYQPRHDAGNGTFLQGTVSVSEDRRTWTEPQAFQWERNGELKEFPFASTPRARYVRLHVTEAVGHFGSGEELYVYKVPGTEGVLQGDINRDGRIDGNDLTGYMNYAGLRRSDSDFDYVSAGDVNRNGLMDAYDISVVTTQLDGGATQRSTDKAAGTLVVKADKTTFSAGDLIVLRVSGQGLQSVNALSFALPYDATELEYVGMETPGMQDMRNLTCDRLHSNGQKELFPCFANVGNNPLLEDGELLRITFRARRAGKFTLKPQDGMLVDRSLGTCPAF